MQFVGETWHKSQISICSAIWVWFRAANWHNETVPGCSEFASAAFTMLPDCPQTYFVWQHFCIETLPIVLTVFIQWFFFVTSVISRHTGSKFFGVWSFKSFLVLLRCVLEHSENFASLQNTVSPRNCAQVGRGRFTPFRKFVLQIDSKIE